MKREAIMEQATPRERSQDECEYCGEDIEEDTRFCQAPKPSSEEWRWEFNEQQRKIW